MHRVQPAQTRAVAADKTLIPIQSYVGVFGAGELPPWRGRAEWDMTTVHGQA